MLMSEPDAVRLVEEVFPDRTVKMFVRFRNLIIVEAIDKSDPEEGSYDPYFSVDSQGNVKDFSLMDAGMAEIERLWRARNS
jgi:hypothetical protein